jgi:tagatose-6-phosphate ketose/aldose isomerase
MAGMIGVDRIQLDPRTNDQSLVMTSSFSNLVLAGLGLAGPSHLFRLCREIARRAEHAFPELEAKAERIAQTKPRRVCILASPLLFPLARETSLKILEMTAGQIVSMPETFLGLRHGPMSFLDREALVVCFLSSDPQVNRYERDLLAELRAKNLGRILVITPVDLDSTLYDHMVLSLAPELPDALRTPFDILFPQLLAYWLTLAIGADPDNPSPAAVITRVVEGVRIYEN